MMYTPNRIATAYSNLDNVLAVFQLNEYY